MFFVEWYMDGDKETQGRRHFDTKADFLDYARAVRSQGFNLHVQEDGLYDDETMAELKKIGVVSNLFPPPTRA